MPADITKLTPEQVQVLAGASNEEVALLTSLRQRLEEASDDLEAHAFLDKLRELSGGYLF